MPTAAPTVGPDGATLLAVDDAGSPLPNNPQLARGQTVIVTASGFAPEEPVVATLHSTPRLLGSSAASTSGIVSYAFTVPADLASGHHTLELKGPTRTSLFAFHVGEATVHAVSASAGATASTAGRSGLPFTGLNATSLLLIALLLLWAGAMLMLYVGPVAAGAARHQRRARHTR